MTPVGVQPVKPLDLVRTYESLGAANRRGEPLWPDLSNR